MAGHSYEHDVEIASRYGFLGSIDANTGDSSLGWDTDQFPMNLKDCAALVQVVLRQGGLQPGGSVEHEPGAHTQAEAETEAEAEAEAIPEAVA